MESMKLQGIQTSIHIRPFIHLSYNDSQARHLQPGTVDIIDREVTRPLCLTISNEVVLTFNAISEDK